MENFLPMSAVCTTSAVTVSGLVWWLASMLGLLKRDGGFNAADMRTWTFGFTLFEATFFGLIFSAIMYAMGGSSTAAAIAGGVAALMSLGLGELLGKRQA